MKPALNIAIIRLSAMGDIIHSASVLPLLLEHLKHNYTPKITWFVDSTFQEILQDSPCIDTLVPLPLKTALKNKNLKMLHSIYQKLKLESFDIALDMQGLLKSALVCRCIPAKIHVGFQNPREPLAKFFYTKQIPIPYAEHILLRNATLAFSAFNLEIPPLQTLKTHPKAFLGFTKQSFDFPPKSNKKILCVLETSKANKTYPLENFLALAKLFNAQQCTPIFITFKPLEIPQNLQEIAQKTEFYNAHSLSLTQIKSLISQMDLVIGGDTGITHLAWALNKPSITLFGATPQERFNLNTSINLSLSANPNANYQKDDFSIHTIPPETILNLANSLLDDSKLPQDKG